MKQTKGFPKEKMPRSEKSVPYCLIWCEGKLVCRKKDKEKHKEKRTGKKVRGTILIDKTIKVKS